MGPGLKKTHGDRTLSERHVRLVRVTDSVTRDWLDVADVISEGRVDVTASGQSYFGSTSVLIAPLPGVDVDRETLLHVVECDPHIRTRVIRLARREAESRARGGLGTMSVDLSFASSLRGVAITVDVAAAIAKGGRALGE